VCQPPSRDAFDLAFALVADIASFAEAENMLGVDGGAFLLLLSLSNAAQKQERGSESNAVRLINWLENLPPPKFATAVCA